MQKPTELRCLTITQRHEARLRLICALLNEHSLMLAERIAEEALDGLEKAHESDYEALIEHEVSSDES
jgi:hypothetical protein